MGKQRKPYNPNTAYGRRKLREQYERESAERWANMTPRERQEHEDELNKSSFILAYSSLCYSFLYQHL